MSNPPIDHPDPFLLTRRRFLQKALLQTGTIAAVVLGGRQLIEAFSVDGSSGIAGVVIDLLTSLPISGATVSGAGEAGTAITSSDGSGRYFLALPPGIYEARVHAARYLDMARQELTVAAGSPTRVDFEMLTASPDPAARRAAYDRLIRSPESPLVSAPLLSAADAAIESVTVPDTIVVRWNDGSQTTTDLDDYLRHVVPAEMPASWHAQALRTQAVAARSYAVAYYQSHGYICATTSCQYYGPNTYDSTDQAVWDTHKIVATAAGAVIWAFFFAQCNGATTRNSEQALANTGYGGTCTVSGWNYVSYCRAKPCSGHNPYGYSSCGYHGHGVGMCQNGAQGFAQQGLRYDQIMGAYYTGIALLGADTTPELLSPFSGYMSQAGNALTLSWRGTSANYSVVVMDTLGNIRLSTTTTQASVVVPGTLAAGSYVWYVSGWTGSSTPRTSATWRFKLAIAIHSDSLGGMNKS